MAQWSAMILKTQVTNVVVFWVTLTVNVVICKSCGVCVRVRVLKQVKPIWCFVMYDDNKHIYC